MRPANIDFIFISRGTIRGIIQLNKIRSRETQQKHTHTAGRRGGAMNQFSELEEAAISMTSADSTAGASTSISQRPTVLAETLYGIAAMSAAILLLITAL
jgi:hypothetical protein